MLGIYTRLLSGSEGCLSSTSPSLPPAKLPVTTLSFKGTNGGYMSVKSVCGHWKLTIYTNKVCDGDSKEDVDPCELSLHARHACLCDIYTVLSVTDQFRKYTCGDDDIPTIILQSALAPRYFVGFENSPTGPWVDLMEVSCEALPGLCSELTK